MKHLKFILGAALTVCGLSAFGQGATSDYFSAPRIINVLQQSSQATSTSNANYTDIHGFEGVAVLFISTDPDNASGTQAITVQSSADTTNWITLPNVAFGVSNAIITTNFYYGTTNFLATNRYMLAGTMTTPTASTAGFATPYIGSIPAFTSSAIFTNTGPVLTTIGFLPSDATRYLRIFEINGGTGTNYGTSVIFMGRKQQ